MTTPRPCSIAATLAVVGEKYALLVLREVLLGVRRFDRIARNTGAPRDVLTARLRRLVEAGVLEKVPYSERPLRHEYVPTDAGLELQPVLLALMDWGDRHLSEHPPTVLVHECGEELGPVVVCAGCGAAATPDSLTARVEAPGWTVSGPDERNA
ncbi:helix-turn-helix domain-containing protein [Streptomyces sp. SCSIO 30461]|uniref:winged helix-turn-helix transcriptional regulator n=1 Tax=Streptomyces sp. SCSIO 30461 TaxID=3118085 RepID=UPI0030CAAD7C